MDNRNKALVTIALIGVAAIVTLQLAQPAIDRGLLTMLIGFLGLMAGHVVTHSAVQKTADKIDAAGDKVEACNEKLEVVAGAAGEALTKSVDAERKASDAAALAAKAAGKNAGLPLRNVE